MSTILLVDDNTNIREAYAEIIEIFGYNCLLAEDGQDAITIMLSTACDLIISDSEMPDMNGYELLHHIKTDPQNSHIPFVLHTGRDKHDLPLNTYDVMPDAILSKPTNLNHFRATIERFLPGD